MTRWGQVPTVHDTWGKVRMSKCPLLWRAAERPELLAEVQTPGLADGPHGLPAEHSPGPRFPASALSDLHAWGTLPRLAFCVHGRSRNSSLPMLPQRGGKVGPAPSRETWRRNISSLSGLSVIPEGSRGGASPVGELGEGTERMWAACPLPLQSSRTTAGISTRRSVLRSTLCPGGGGLQPPRGGQFRTDST